MSKFYVTLNGNNIYSNLLVNFNELRLKNITEVMQNLLGLEYDIDVNFDIDYTEINFYFLSKKSSYNTRPIEVAIIKEYFKAILTLFEIEDN